MKAEKHSWFEDYMVVYVEIPMSNEKVQNAK
jgi:hypothetical protein